MLDFLVLGAPANVSRPAAPRSAHASGLAWGGIAGAFPELAIGAPRRNVGAAGTEATGLVTTFALTARDCRTSSVEPFRTVGVAVTSAGRVDCLRVAPARTRDFAPVSSAPLVDLSLARLAEESSRESDADERPGTRLVDCAPGSVFDVEPVLPGLADPESVPPAGPEGPRVDDTSETPPEAPAGSAAASPHPTASVTPMPTPRATAKPPTRPMHPAVFMTVIRTRLTRVPALF